MTAITAITAQNTTGVSSIVPIHPKVVAKQILFTCKDIKPDAVKIGMLHSSELIRSVIESLRFTKTFKIVLDPVIVAKGGARLIDSKAIKTLKEKFNCDVGYSGHESSGYNISLAAAVLGATSIERHITTARAMYGSDQAASLEPLGLVRLVRDIRMLDLIMGDGVKKVYPSEIPVMKKLREQN